MLRAFRLFGGFVRLHCAAAAISVESKMRLLIRRVNCLFSTVCPVSCKIRACLFYPRTLVCQQKCGAARSECELE